MRDRVDVGWRGVVPRWTADARRPLAGCRRHATHRQDAGLVGFGGIAAEVARIALGGHAWHCLEPVAEEISRGSNAPDLDEVLTDSDVISIHLLLTDETRLLIARAASRR